MPTRILLRLFLLAGLAAPFCAFALGVGSLQVRSALNQNFNADIPLIVNNPAELVGLTVRIPGQQEFDQVGVDRLKLMSSLRFVVQTPPGGPNVIKVTSVQPIREPNFDLLLEVVWPRGRLLRTFPVQLDPELYTHRQEPPPPLQPTEEAPLTLVEAPPIAPAAPGLPPPPPVSFEGASFYGPVRPGENLTRIANQVRPSGIISVSDMMAILVAGNPEAFISGNPNLLRVGAVLKVPTASALGVQGAPVSEPAMQVATAPTPIDSTLGPPATAPALPESPASQPSEIAKSPESFAPPVSQPSEISATPPVSEPSGIASPVPHEEIPKPDVPSAEGALPTLAESAPSVPLTPIAPQEILPQTVMPQAETPPMSEATTPIESPEPPPIQEAVKPTVEPESQPTPAPAPETLLPQETGMEWLSNPVVWVAIALIVLAVASVLLVPLLRRPARRKKAAAEPKEELASASPHEASEVAAGTQAQIHRSRPQKQQSSILAEANATAPASSAEPAPKPGVVPPPKPIDDLLKDIDFSLGDEKSRAAPPGGKKDAAPARGLEGRRLPDAEPPTASVTRTPDSPLGSSMLSDKPEARTPVPRPPAPKPAPPIQHSAPKPMPEQPSLEPLSELPSGLKLDSLDFDLGGLGLSAGREQPAELPPLELKPAEPPKAVDRKPSFDLPEIDPPTHSGAQEPPDLKASDLKFEFTNVNQEYEKSDVKENLAKLDEELLNFGDTDLGQMELGSLGTTAETGADYVETKLDLASAYLDMGDQMGARGLLEDVLREGDASQKKRAEDMLKKVG